MIRRSGVTIAFVAVQLLALSAFVGCGGGDGDSGRGTPEVPTNPPTEPNPNPPPTENGTNIVVFLADKQTLGVVEMYKYDENSNTIVKLNGELVNGGNVTSFAISPDRQYVAYVADQETDEHFELYVADMDGSGLRRVSIAGTSEAANDDVADDIVWTPDSTRIAYRSDERTETSAFFLRTVRPDGSDNVVVTPAGLGPGDVLAESAEWAPDSSRIAYLASVDGVFYDLYTSPADSPVGAARLSGLTSNREVLDHAWAPDSTRMLYVADRGTDGCYELFSNDAAGGDNTLLSRISCTLGDLDVVEGTAVWAPDSSLVAYLSDEGGDGVVNLYTVQPDGSSRVQLTNATGNLDVVSKPSWALDSSLLAYVADLNVDETFELFTSNPSSPGSTTVNGPLLGGGVEVGLTGFSPPAWAPDSSLIAYIAEESTAGKKQVYVGDPDGIFESVVLSPEANTLVEFGPVKSIWAPDGSRVQYRADQTTAFTRDLYTATVDGLNNDKVTRTPAVTDGLDGFADWMPDSSGVVYLSEQNTAGVVELYGATLDGVVNSSISGALITGGNVESFYVAD